MSRILAVGAYLLGGLLIWSARGAHTALLFSLTQAVTLLLILFADALEGWLGPFPFLGSGSRNVVDEPSPAWLITGFGWLILLGVFALSYWWV
jgi:hypothetical protein